MEVGTPLKIEIKGTTNRITSELIGIKENEYLIIKMPPMHSLGEDKNLFYQGNELVIRYMHKGIIFGFITHINMVIFNPERLIFIEFPKKIENYELRTNKRIDCYLPANIKLSDSIIKGCITDISKEGCQFIVETSRIASNINNLQIDSKISVGFNLPGVEKELATTALMKNVKKDNKNVNIGLVFTNMDDDVMTKFNEFFSRAVSEL